MDGKSRLARRMGGTHAAGVNGLWANAVRLVETVPPRRLALTSPRGRER